LWTGVPLREVLEALRQDEQLCAASDFWGFHNNDEKQVFKSSVSYTQ